MIDPEGGVTGYNFVAVGFLPTIQSITNPNGVQVVQNVFDGQGRVTRQILPNGSEFNFSYTIEGGIVTEGKVTDPIGNTFACRFDGQGIPIQRTNELLQPQIVQREPGTNRILGEVDALGRETSLEYGENGNVTRIIRADDSSTAFTYDPTFNQVQTITNALG